jgi:hypothetical protein
MSSANSTVEEVEDPVLVEQDAPAATPASDAPATATTDAAPSTDAPAADPNALPADDPSNSPDNVNLPTIWRTLGSSLVPSFTITPKDISSIYTLVMWTYLNNHYVPADGNLENVPQIKADAQVYVTKVEFVRLISIFFQPTFRQIFRNLASL